MAAKLATRSVLLLSIGGVIAFGVLELWVLPAAGGYRGQLSLIAADMNVWPSQTVPIVSSYGPPGRLLFVWVHIVDMLFAVSYALLLLNVLARLGRRIGLDLDRSAPLLWIPLLAGLADCLENVWFIVLAVGFPRTPAAIVWLAAACTWAKFGLLSISLGIVIAWLLIGDGRPRAGRRMGFAAGASSLLVLAVIGGELFSNVDLSPAPTALPAPGCSTLLVLGLRGNGDPLTRDSGMGGDSGAVVAAVRALLPSGMDWAPIGFPYVTGPWAQVVGRIRAGARLLSAYIAGRNRLCPSERLVLVGQSEGAAVVHLSLTNIGAQLTAAVLLGDPLRVAGSTYDELRSGNDGLLVQPLIGGIDYLGRPVTDVVPASLQPAVRSYCLPTDPVCNFSLGTELQSKLADAHTGYKHEAAIVNAAAAFVLSRIMAGTSHQSQPAA